MRTRPESQQNNLRVILTEAVRAQFISQGFPLPPASIIDRMVDGAADHLKEMPFATLSPKDSRVAAAINTSYSAVMSQLSETQQFALKLGLDPYSPAVMRAAGTPGGLAQLALAASGSADTGDKSSRRSGDLHGGEHDGTPNSRDYSAMSGLWKPASGAAGLNDNNFNGTPFWHIGLDLGTTKALYKQGFNQPQIIAAASLTNNLGIDVKQNVAAVARLKRDVPGVEKSLTRTRDNWGDVHALEEAAKEAREKGETDEATKLEKAAAEAHKRAEEFDRKERERVKKTRPDRADDLAHTQEALKQAELAKSKDPELKRYSELALKDPDDPEAKRLRDEYVHKNQKDPAKLKALAQIDKGNNAVKEVLKEHPKIQEETDAKKTKAKDLKSKMMAAKASSPAAAL